MARRSANGARGQGRRAPAGAGPRARLNHDRASHRALSARVRHDRDGRDASRRVSGRSTASTSPLSRRIVPSPGRIIPTRSSASKAEKEAAVREEIRRVHASGRPVLVGTSSVEESERLSRALVDVPHHVLNARNEAEEAAIIARAGERGAVTISTNMAGRGVDIRLGAGVAGLGGLHVIGTNRHDSRRIDHQLRGRAGRQGDPGSSRFFVSREDPLMVKFGERQARCRSGSAPAHGRRTEPGHPAVPAQVRVGDRGSAPRHPRKPPGHPRADLDGRTRFVRLDALDDLWSDYLAAVTELRSGHAMDLTGLRRSVRSLPASGARDVRRDAGLDRGRGRGAAGQRIEAEDGGLRQRGATWTYLTTDEPFGDMTNRIMRHIAAFLRQSLGLP